MAVRRWRTRAVLGTTMSAMALLAVACVEPPPSPATTTTTTSTTTTEPTTTTSTTTSTTSTTTTTTSTTTTSTTTTSTTTTTTMPPSPVYTPVAMTCLTSALGTTSTDTLDTGVTTEAPASVPAGSSFEVELTADPIEVPTTGGGFSIQHLKNVKVRFAVPAGATYLGATLSGGSNLGSGTPTITVVGDVVTLNVPGQLAPGTTAVLPTVTLTLQAGGTPGTQLPFRLSGTGYADPSISFTARVAVLFGVDANSNCYAPVNPLLAETAIS